MAAAKGGAVQISEPRIEEHPAMVVAGVSQVFPLDGDFSSLWDELNQKASPAMLDVLNVTQYLGVCTQPTRRVRSATLRASWCRSRRARRSLVWACWSCLRAPMRWLR